MKLRLELGCGRFAALVAAVFAAAALKPAPLASESVTLSTYYPAPSGVYTKLLSTGQAWLARDGGGVMIGSTNTPSQALEVDGDVRYTGHLGIGTTSNPSTYALDVTGANAFRIGTFQFLPGAPNVITGGSGLQLGAGGSATLGVGAAGSLATASGTSLTVNGTITSRASCSLVNFAPGTDTCQNHGIDGYVALIPGRIEANPWVGANTGNGSNFGSWMCCSWPGSTKAETIALGW